MKSIILFPLLFFCVFAQGQERFFDRAIKKGREAGGLYKVEIKDGSVVKRNILTKFSKEYILRNIETQIVNRFGDTYEGIKSFEFLPVKEIFQFVYDNKLTPELSNYQSTIKDMIAGSKKGSLYFFDNQNATFNLFKDFYWNGEVVNGFVNGSGVGVYYNEYNQVAFAVKGNFKDGILNGNGVFVSYKFDGRDHFDSGKSVTHAISLSDFQDGMAVLTSANQNGFVNDEMLIKINPKYRKVLQPFKEGRATVVNENNEEIVIDKSDGFVSYTPRQQQIFDERKKAEEARQWAVIENEIRTDYIEAVNSGQETRLLAFYRKYVDSEYDFARKYAGQSLDKARELSLVYEIPFKEAAYYDHGDRLVKIIVSSKDGLPVSAAAESLYHFLDDQFMEQDTAIYFVQGPSDGVRVFAALNQPVSFLDKCIINGEWNNTATDTGDASQATPPGFEAFRKVVESYAHNNDLIIQYLGYWGGLQQDTAAYQTEKDKVANLLKNHCTRAEIEGAENPNSGISTPSTGQIKMKSGEVYTWVYDGEGFSIRVSWMEGRFETFGGLIESFREECRKRFCARIGFQDKMNLINN